MGFWCPEQDNPRQTGQFDPLAACILPSSPSYLGTRFQGGAWAQDGETWFTGAFKTADGMPPAPGPQPGAGDAGEREAGQVAAWGFAFVFLLPSLPFKSPSWKESAFRGVSPGKGKGQSRTSLMPALPREQRVRGGGPAPGGNRQPSSSRTTESPASPPFLAKPGCVSSLGKGVQPGSSLPARPSPALSALSQPLQLLKIQPLSLWHFTPFDFFLFRPPATILPGVQINKVKSWPVPCPKPPSCLRNSLKVQEKEAKTFHRRGNFDC